MLTLVQAIGLRVLYFVARRLVSRAVFERLSIRVRVADDLLSPMGERSSGPEKKAWVLARLADQGLPTSAEVAATPTWLLSMLVDVIVANMKAQR